MRTLEEQEFLRSLDEYDTVTQLVSCNEYKKVADAFLDHQAEIINIKLLGYSGYPLMI